MVTVFSQRPNIGISQVTNNEFFCIQRELICMTFEAGAISNAIVIQVTNQSFKVLRVHCSKGIVLTAKPCLLLHLYFI